MIFLIQRHPTGLRAWVLYHKIDSVLIPTTAMAYGFDLNFKIISETPTKKQEDISPIILHTATYPVLLLLPLFVLPRWNIRK